MTFDRQTLILKNGGKWNFSYEMKALIRLSQSGEWISSLHALKERRLLNEFMIIPFDKRTLILKNDRKWSFSYETKASIRLSR